MSRTILHVDMDAFFAAIEVLDQPDLAGRPLVVGGTPEGRGVVAAASYEARQFGIHSAMSAWQAKKRCPHALFMPPRFNRYREVSTRIFTIFHIYTPLVEPLSIDEAFLDVTGCARLFGPGPRIAADIKRRIREEIGLTASVGVAPNKFLAKLASDFRKPDGLFIVEPERAAAWLAELPVSRLWGVGKVTQRMLAGLGILTVAQLLAYPRGPLERRIGSWAATLLELAQGLDERPVEPETDAKSIGAETTFERDIADPARLRHELDLLVERTAWRLRRAGCLARTVHLKARFPDFTTVTRAMTLPRASDQTRVLRQAARELLESRLERNGIPLRLIGVSYSNLVTEDEGQLELFGDPPDARERQMDQLLDRLRTPEGKPLVRRGLLGE